GSPSATGSLTGLIGANGAVASFISDDRNPLSPDGGFVVNFGNYAGGFVALPPATPSTAPRVDFETWLASFDAPNIPLTRAIRTQDFTSGNDKQYFIQGTVFGLNRANDNYANEKGGNNPTVLTLGESFDGDVYDGVAYLVGTHQRAYAGVLLGTDLGAPVTGTTGTTAQWAGVFHDSRYVTTETSFTLTVGFTAQGGTLDALVERLFGGNERTGINGAFDANGVITGEVINGTPNTSGCLTNGVLTVTESCFTGSNTATLTGLIGEQGAVGAFTGQWGNTPIRGWAGGFVSVFCGGANPPKYCTVDIEDWLGDFNTRPHTDVIRTALGQNGTGVFGGFLRISARQTGIVRTSPLKITSASSPLTESVNLTRAGSGDNGGSLDGVSYLSGYRGANNQAFVSILPTTNLGAPLVEQPTTAAWPGFYYDSTVSGTAQNAITFEIDFSMRDINVMANSVG
ncbi:MAG: hypothetical protein K8953_13240, partial [Proteobacteria bacterium]|nr:hypothetical protein [Pseudomonadota bacterium]